MSFSLARATCRRLSPLVVVLGLSACASTGPVALDHRAAAPGVPTQQQADPYFVSGREALQRALARRPNTGRAKNVILFIGDGMGPSTVTAGRIYEGQSRQADGESNVLSFERLPYVALSKTYSVDTQVVDSAASATALLTGVKTRNRMVGLSGQARTGVCASAAESRVSTLAELARAQGRSTGAVTSTRLTHATPAAVYAHTPHRDWEADADMPAAAKAAGCTDIARQLVEAGPLKLNVALGGGMARFRPSTAAGRRQDGRDLVAEWAAAPGSVAVTDRAALQALAPGSAQHVLGLFAPDHLPYEADRADGGSVPSLAEMTVKAIELLSANPKGYVLMVEGGRIDHASHANNAFHTLSETAAFHRAIAAALAKVDLADTLVVVTADHSHGLVLSGYSERNAPILGIAGDEGEPILAGDGKPYTALGFHTGPGGPRGTASRRDPRAADLADPRYVQDAAVHLGSSAHGGEDVGVYAGGPQAHLLEGVIEQSFVFHVLRHALGL